MAESALLVIDLQRDFLEDDGRMPVARTQVEPLLRAANALIDAATSRGALVVYILNAFPATQRVANFFRRGAAVAGTPGAQLDPRVHVVSGGTFIKERGDAFTNPALAAFLRERRITRLAILGVFAPACVRATTRGALREGYRVTVVSDGVAAGSDRARDRALALMTKDGASLARSETVETQL
jgi:nicotinamidase-related amidase